MKIVETEKLVIILGSWVFWALYQITNPLSFILLINFYKIYKIFPHINFIVFALLYMGPILLYQFINLFKRFGKYVFYLNLLLNKIDKVGFAS